MNPDRDNYLAYALVLILLVGMIWRSYQIDQEFYLDSLNEIDVYTSGATMRRLGQKFTSTNQGTYTIIHDAEQKSNPIRAVIYPNKN